MAKFLLIHGSCHGAWCFDELLPLLNSNGHSASAIDLPGHGDDTTPVAECSLDGYAQKVVDNIDEPVILVGHSLAGVTISAAAELAPEKITRLVYLTAWLPRDGDSARALRVAAGCPNLVEASIMCDDDTTTFFKPELTQNLFYHDCPEGTYEHASKHLCHEPLEPQRTVLSLGANFDNMAKSYIRCLDDHAIPAHVQTPMAERLASTDQYTLNGAHSPFYAQPDKLTEILFEIAKTT